MTRNRLAFAAAAAVLVLGFILSFGRSHDLFRRGNEAISPVIPSQRAIHFSEAELIALQPSAIVSPAIPLQSWPEHNLDTPEMVIAFIRGRMSDGGASWTDAWVQRARLRFIQSMMHEDVSTSGMPQDLIASLEVPHWILGFKSSRIIPTNEILSLVSMGNWPGSQPSTDGSREVFVILNTAGSIDRVGVLDPPNELGTPVPDYTLWRFEEIEALPTVVVPTSN